MNRKQHKKRIEEFLKNTLGRCLKKEVQYSINLNDEHDEGTAYEVKITNQTNDEKRFVVLQTGDYDYIEMLMGEDFVAIDETYFFAYLFMQEFLTLQEI
jgi:hypothetical protein